MKFLLFVLCVCPLLLNAEYTKLQWSDCGSKEATIYEIDVKPMPILQPGEATLNFRMNLKRALNGKLKTTLNIVRSVSGVALPIRCYIASGVYVGSCTYDDICDIIKSLLPNFTPDSCPASLAVYGIDCNCPFNIKAGKVELLSEQLDLPDASQSVATFLASGDFDIKMSASDAIGSYGCINFKFTVKPSSQGK